MASSSVGDVEQGFSSGSVTAGNTAYEETLGLLTHPGLGNATVASDACQEPSVIAPGPRAGSEHRDDEESATGPKICRFCLEEEGSESYSGGTDPLIAPCLCSGSSRYVHRKCLQQWRESGARALSKCTTCGYEYQFEGRRVSLYSFILRSRLLPVFVIVTVLITISALLGFVPIVGDVDGRLWMHMMNGYSIVGIVLFGITVGELFSYEQAMRMWGSMNSRWARCILLFLFQWVALLLIVVCLAVAAALPMGNMVLAIIGTNHLSLGPAYRALRESFESSACTADVRAEAELRVVEVTDERRAQVLAAAAAAAAAAGAAAADLHVLGDAGYTGGAVASESSAEQPTIERGASAGEGDERGASERCSKPHVGVESAVVAAQPSQTGGLDAPSGLQPSNSGTSFGEKVLPPYGPLAGASLDMEQAERCKEGIGPRAASGSNEFRDAEDGEQPLLLQRSTPGCPPQDMQPL